eukprot:510805-Karenia_brevis.AAC.1
MLTVGTLVQLPGKVGAAKVIRRTKGVPQGHQASPLISLCVLADVLEPVVERWQARGFGVRVLQSFLCLLDFADDVWILAEHWQHFQVMFQEFVDGMARYDFVVEVGKCSLLTNVSLAEPLQLSISQPDGGSSIVLTQLPVGQTARCLGYSVSADIYDDGHLTDRIAATARYFYARAN